MNRRWLEYRSVKTCMQMKNVRGNVQLPPQMRIEVPMLLSRGIERHCLENKASQAVIEAKGNVAASCKEMFFGTRKLMLSSATEYSLYAPMPLISPLDLSGLHHNVE